MKKNILFIGNYRNEDGWATAARAWIKALATTNNNLQIRPIYTTNKFVQNLPLEFVKLENVELDHYDVVIQNVLPHYLEYNRNFGKNICLTAIETAKWKNVWPRKLKMMDEVWVPCQYSKDCILKSCGIDSKIIPIPYSLGEGKPADIIPSNVLKNKFVFYFIGEYIRRKNLDMVVRAFHTEFYRNEPVELVIKTNRLGVDSKQLAEVLINNFDRIKKEIGIYGSTEHYKNELIITDHVSNEYMAAIHKSCNCFVLPSCGEAWSIPAMDAAVAGNQVIMTNTGCSQYADYIVESEWSNVQSTDKPLPDLFTGTEEWLEPSFMSLRKNMRLAYMNKDKVKKEKDFSPLLYKSVGELMCRHL
jgi:glycosyltransferase involved in cell wall biosynthesis